jgi:hypothetical protein
MEQGFAHLDTVELRFVGGARLVLPNAGLMWNRRPASPLVHFSRTDTLTLGTILLSKFKAIEFHLEPNDLHIAVFSR